MHIYSKIILFLTVICCLCVLSQDKKTSTIDNSRFVNQSVPTTMKSGVSYSLIITFENNGTTTWQPGSYRLNIIEDPSTQAVMTWGISNMELTEIVFPGKTISFEIKVTAPAAEGTYKFRCKMMHGEFPFGETSNVKEIVISKNFTGSESVNNAAFVEQTVQKTMQPGKEYKVMISMTNTGSMPWTPGNYRLVSLSATGENADNLWLKNNIELTETIPVGSSKVFNFKITAPDKQGSYLFQWRMSASDGGLFGDASTPVMINVNNSPLKR